MAPILLYDITEIVLKVSLNTLNPNPNPNPYLFPDGIPKIPLYISKCGTM
jgi:hypothetical protein